MDTSTGRFISQDSYAGSTADPVSLHKYLYANSNPVMYSDPSGYYSLGETMTTCAVLGALSGGIINASMNVLRFLCGDPDITSKYDSPISAFLNGFVNGMVWGLFFGITVGVLLTFGPYVALAVGFNFGSAYYYYSLAKSALEAEDWASAVYYSFLCMFSVTCAFVTYSSAVDNKKLAEEQAKQSTIRDKGEKALKNADIDKFEIKNKHLDSSGGKWAKFNVSTAEDAKSIVKNAVSNGKVVSITEDGLGTQGQMSYKAIIETDAIIGTHNETQITIIYDEDGNVWTVFPSK